MNVVVTGATGFVGAPLLVRLLSDGRTVRAAVRNEFSGVVPTEIERVSIGNITPNTDWHRALADVDVVIHLAARVHVTRERATDPLAEFRSVNTLGTLNLARQAVEQGARRLVFLSSVKAMSEIELQRGTRRARPDPYGTSKREAETGLRALATESGLEVVIIRSPIVYGPGVKANFRALMQAIERGVPLPFGAVNNRRSLIALGNLVDFIAISVAHPAAANETFTVSDGEDLSTTELVRRLANAMGRRARLIPVPPRILQGAAIIMGRREMAERLLGSLYIDSSRARRVLDWHPPLTVDEGLRRVANDRDGSG